MLFGNFCRRKVLFPVCLAPNKNILSSNSLFMWHIRSIIPCVIKSLYCGFSWIIRNGVADFHRISAAKIQLFIGIYKHFLLLYSVFSYFSKEPGTIKKQIPILIFGVCFSEMGKYILLFHKFNGCLKNVSSIYGLCSIYTNMKWWRNFWYTSPSRPNVARVVG